MKDYYTNEEVNGFLKEQTEIHENLKEENRELRRMLESLGLKMHDIFEISIANDEIRMLKRELKEVSDENEWRKEYQRTLELKIRRLKARIRVLEK